MEPTSTKRSLDLGRCLNDAMEVYRKNFLTFLLAGILFDLLSICSLLVLAGPLWGGSVMMSLNAMRHPDRTARLGDLFGAFNRFGTLVALFLLTAIPILIGYAALLLPGLLLSALWIFAVFLVVDRDMGVMDSLRMSWRIVVQRGLWINVAAAFVLFAILAGPILVPYVSWLVSWLIAPLAWLFATSAYLQEIPEHSDLTEFAPRGFPVHAPMASVAPTATV